MRALRRLMVRHPPSNNQRTAALFLALGHHDALVMRLKRAYKQRWTALKAAFEEHRVAGQPTLGGSSAWVQGPQQLDATRLAQEARKRELIIEPGEVYFYEQPPPKNYFRLGFSSIDAQQIGPGIAILADLIKQQDD